MAQSELNPKNGAVTIPSYTADFASFDIDAGQAVDNVTPYGSQVCSRNVGSGTPDFAFNVGAFAVAHAANTPPDLANSNGGTSTVFTSQGAASTILQLDTGVSYTFQGIMQRIRISHARMRGFVPLALSLRNQGEVTEAWTLT